MKPVARKYKGRYKACILFEGRIQVLGTQRRPTVWRGKQSLPGCPEKLVNTLIFDTKEEAIAFADEAIQKLLKAKEESAERYRQRHMKRLSRMVNG